MDRLAAFERMLADIRSRSARETELMERLRAEGKERTATYKQYVGNRLMYKMMLDLYREYDLLD